ncbi:MAG: phenylacetate--CoA ligase [Wenzhouxiangellaceae bacterium]
MLANQQSHFERFKKELNYSYEKVPFYRKYLDSSGIHPGSIRSLDDVQKLPCTEKQHFRKNFPLGVLAQGYKPNDRRLTRSQSSGTTGERLITVEVGMLLLNRAMKCAKVNPAIEKAIMNYKRKTCRYAAPNCSDVECANPNSTMEDRLLSDGTLVLPVYHDLLTTSDELIERALHEICEYQPDLYYIDPTHFAFLMRHALRRGIDLPKAPVMATYTSPTQCSRQQIAAGFGDGTGVIELLASSEMGWLGLECPQGNLHMNTDSFFLEVMRDDRYAQAGESGELYVTSLDNGALPHIRYKTGDAVRLLDQPCGCGSHLPVAEMQGRMMNFIKQQGRYLASPKQIDHLIGAPAWLDQYQCHQTAEDQVMLKVMVNDHYHDGAERELAAKIDQHLNGACTVTTEKLTYIATERSGKFHATKSDVETTAVFGEHHDDVS